jgi:hypothetical protein
MSKKIFKMVCLFVALVVVTAFFATTISTLNASAPDHGTCCRGGTGTCVIGTYVQEKSYYKEEGPC